MGAWMGPSQVKRVARASVLASIVVASACSSSSSDSRASAQVGPDVMRTPWPSDALLVNGHLKVEGLAFDGARDTALRDLEAALDELDGAPLKASIFFPVEGGTLPAGKMDGAARVIDLTTEEPDPPIDFPLFYRDDTKEIVALTPPGHAFRGGHRYAATLDERWVHPSSALADALAGRGPLASVYAPLVATMKDTSHVGAATVFTCGHPTKLLETLRDQADALPLPTLAIDKVLTGAALDDFFGTPAGTREGLGDPSGIKHDAIGIAILGTFKAPLFLDHGTDHLGRIELDDQGRAKQQGTVDIPFLLTLPKDKGAGLAGTPLLIFQHGLNAGRMQVAAVADDYARAGYATIGVDALWHGDRRPGHKDVVHDFSGAQGPDGLADDDAFGASLLFFDFVGDDAVGVHPLDGRIVRDNFRQAVLELTELVRLLKEGDLSPIAAADPSLSSLALDASHLVYTSESFGSVLGAMTLGVDTRLTAGVLSVGGAGIFMPIFPDSPLFAKLDALFVKPAFDPAIDVSQPDVLPAEAQRSLSLLQAVIEPGDPVSFAPMIVRRPRRAPKSIVLLQAFSDELIPNQGGELLAAQVGATTLTIPGHTQPLRYVTSLPSASPPVAGNENGVTAAHLDVDPATHIMFTRFHDQRTLVPGFPPMVPLSPPQDIDEPLEWLQKLTTDFADDVRAGSGAPPIAPPP